MAALQTDPGTHCLGKPVALTAACPVPLCCCAALHVGCQMVCAWSCCCCHKQLPTAAVLHCPGSTCSCLSHLCKPLLRQSWLTGCSCSASRLHSSRWPLLGLRLLPQQGMPLQLGLVLLSNPTRCRWPAFKHCLLTGVSTGASGHRLLCSD